MNLRVPMQRTGNGVPLKGHQDQLAPSQCALRFSGPPTDATSWLLALATHTWVLRRALAETRSLRYRR